MGFYKDGKYVYEPMDAGNGLCDQEVLDKQNQEREERKRQDNAGMEAEQE